MRFKLYDRVYLPDYKQLGQIDAITYLGIRVSLKDGYKWVIPEQLRPPEEAANEPVLPKPKADGRHRFDPHWQIPEAAPKKRKFK